MEPIVTPIYDEWEDEKELLYTRVQTPTAQWTSDQYVGSTRAAELGMWKSDDDPNRTWTAPATTTFYEDKFGSHMVVVETDGVYFEIDSYRDQWGTYYYMKIGKESPVVVIAQEDGTRSTLQALHQALGKLIETTEYHMQEPTCNGSS